MVQLKPALLDAFAVLGLSPDTDQPTAAKAYKRLALLHHPDRNHGDYAATERFQQIGAAWDICQRHFDNPSWGHIPESSAAHTHSSAFTYEFSQDDDIPLDEDELRAFYEFMFKETIFGRYSRSKGQRYRYERSGKAGAGIFTFSGGFAESQARQQANTERQRKENDDYEKRKRELELEIEQEEKERQKLAKKLKADADRLITALENAFQASTLAASAGNSAQVRQLVLDYDLDVNAPRKRGKQARKPDHIERYDSLLHVATSHCDEVLVLFLIERGAKANTLDRNQLTPFHTAIKAGNIDVVRFIMDRRGRLFEGYHPSKAAPSGCTPLQLAIESRVPAMVELLVKDATTHDVMRCWKSESISEEIKQILLRKKGFVPPGEDIKNLPSASKISTSQQQAAKQKETRIAEELKRAAINWQKKEERAAKQATRERAQEATQLAQEEARQKTEMEVHHRLEDKHKVQETAKELEQARLRAESSDHTESRAKAGREAYARPEAKAHPHSECASRAETTPLSKPDIKRQADARPEKKVNEINENKITISKETTMRETQSSGTANAEKLPLRADVALSKHKAETTQQPIRGKFIKNRRAKELQNVDSEATSTAAIGHSTPTQLTPKSIPNKKRPTSMEALPRNSETVNELQMAKQNDVLRRRAEQSARDKERHRRAVAERTKVATNQQTGTDYVPLSPVSTLASRTYSPTNSDTIMQPSPSPSPPTPPFSVTPLTLEDVQTVIVPDDLFKDDLPYIADSKSVRRFMPKWNKRFKV